MNNESTSSQEEIEDRAKEYSDEFTETGLFKFNNEAKYDAYIAGALSREAELAACRQSIAELTVIAEDYHSFSKRQIESAIERAKALIK